MKSVGSIALEFFLSVFGLGLGADVVAVLLLGHVSSDAGGPAGSLAYGAIATGVLAVTSSAVFGLALLPVGHLLTRLSANHRRLLAAFLGAMVMVFAGVGGLSALGRLLYPAGGRLAWILLSGLPGLAAALIVIALTPVWLRPLSVDRGRL